MRRGTLRVFALVALALAGIASPNALGAEFGIPPGSLAVEVLDSEGNPENLAGAHPDRLRIAFGLQVEETGTAARDFIFDVSPGLGSDIDAVPTCSRALFAFPLEECPANTQIGILSQDSFGETLELPVWNLEPAPGQAAVFGVKPLWTVPFVLTIRPGDYGLTFEAPDLVQFPLGSGGIELWGVPADHQSGPASPRRPFLTTPTRCGPMSVALHIRSWEVNAPWLSDSASSTPFEDCASLPFAPQLQIELDNSVADAQTGARIELAMPEDVDPDGRASSLIEDVTLRLPEGVTVSPAGAQNLAACSDARFGFGSSAEAECPADSKIGTVELESPQLHVPLTGSIYLGEEHPGNRFRMLVSAPGPGVTLKLVSTLHADPATGRLSASLVDLPQIPMGRLSMNLDGGAQALLSTPVTCGHSSAVGRFEPYSGGSAVESVIPFSISARGGSECRPAPFAPRMVAGATNPRAGRSTAFSVTLRREDGEQIPSRFAVTLPPGLNGAFGVARRCGDAGAESGDCPSDSRIGQAVAEVGPGPGPAPMRGGVFLTGPYRGAPFGLAISFRAAIGPFDLGRVVTRAALRVDRHSGRVTVATDPLPRVVAGVPIRFKTLGLDIDRRGLLHNPTSCAPMSIEASIQAAEGGAATTKTPFALRGCNRLGFRPRFALALTGSAELHAQGRPGLSVSARTKRGDTNLRDIRIALPRLLKFSSAHIQEICSRRDASDGKCGPRTRVGTAYARTPLLAQRLKGPIFVVQPEGDGLPDLRIGLAAMGLEIDLLSESSRKNGRFVTKMTDLPDLPLSNFTMHLPPGRRSILALRAGLCKDGKARSLDVPIGVSGQNGAYRQSSLSMASKTRCDR
jgi:hypothetical protein